MFKAYKYRIYPTEAQKSLIEQTFAACRCVYNVALETKMRAYKEHGVNLSSFDLCYQLAEMKQDYAWIQQVDSQALQASVKKIDIAFKNFYKGSGYPKFKSKKSNQAFQCPNHKRKVDFERGTITIPKIANIPAKISRTFYGKIKTITISRTLSGNYFASVLVDNEQDVPIKLPIDAKKTIGIDLGIKDFAIINDGVKIENPKYLHGSLNRLKCLQRRLNHKKKGSNNRKKAAKRLAVIHEKIANQRKDFLQKSSTQIVNDNQVTTICVEGLAVKNMVKNHNLARAISDTGWGMFIEMLKYKCEWTGKNLIQIGRFEPSTKTCSCCGAINQTITLSDRSWTCANCLSTHDRDINAAKNIKIMGLTKSRQGMSVEPVELLRKRRTKKQEYN